MTIAATPFDAAKYLGRPEAQAELLQDALETGDAGYIAHALSVIARAKDLAAAAEEEDETEPGGSRAALRGSVRPKDPLAPPQ